MITDGFYRTNYGKGIAGAVVVAAVALVLEVLAALVQRAVTPAGSSSPKREGAMSAGDRTVSSAVEQTAASRGN